MELITGENDEGRRLDRILRKALPDLNLPFIYRLLRQKKVLINGIPGKAQDRLEYGVKIIIPSLDNSAAHNITAPASKTSDNFLQILWEGSGLLAVNKPAGLTVHGPESLETAVRSYLTEKLPPSLSFKPGPLHRLDKPSSGIVIFSSNLEGSRLFSLLLKERKIKKTYLAITEGKITNDKIWQDDLYRDKKTKKTYIRSCKESKSAITKISPLAVKSNYSLIEAQILTGRTHQIRAQSSFHGHPLAGDLKYGGKKLLTKGFFLHAWKLEFLKYSIKAPLPEEFEKVIKSLFDGITLASFI